MQGSKKSGEDLTLKSDKSGEVNKLIREWDS